jgi:hypothetical protein
MTTGCTRMIRPPQATTQVKYTRKWRHCLTSTTHFGALRARGEKTELMPDGGHCQLVVTGIFRGFLACPNRGSVTAIWWNTRFCFSSDRQALPLRFAQLRATPFTFGPTQPFLPLRYRFGHFVRIGHFVQVRALFPSSTDNNARETTPVTAPNSNLS